MQSADRNSGKGGSGKSDWNTKPWQMLRLCRKPSSMDCNVFPGYLPDLYVIRLKSWITIGKGMPSRPNEVAK